MFVIVMNGTNIVQDGQNNKLVYKFPNSMNLTNKYLAVSSVSMYYSWFNITAVEQNNTFSFEWVSGLLTRTTYTIVIPDGLWDVTTINQYLQFKFIEFGTYYSNAQGENLYPFELIINVNRYAVQLNTYLIPSSLPVGYTTPSNFPGFPSTAQNVLVTFPSKFNEIIGYFAGFTSDVNVGNSSVLPPPTVNTNYASKNSIGTISYLSNTSPQIQPNSSILFSVSNVNNPYAQPSSIVYSLNSSVGIGELIVDKPPNYLWTKMIDGVYNELRLALLSPNLKPISINDPNMTILLTIRDKDDLL